MPKIGERSPMHPRERPITIGRDKARVGSSCVTSTGAPGIVPEGGTTELDFHSKMINNDK